LSCALVTGATGFIGRHTLSRLAERGFDVHAVARSMPPDRSEATWHTTDLLEPGAAERLVRTIRPSHLLHLAWFATPGEFWSSPENHRWVEASTTLIREFAAAGGKRVVVAGTCAEYDWNSGLCVEGETPLEPATLYGHCKHVLHERTQQLAREAGIAAAWGRIFFVYGPHEHPDRLVASVICSLLRGAEARCSHGQQVRDFLHVADVADAFVALVASDAAGPVNIASGSPTRVRDIVELVAAAIGRRDLLRFGAVSTPPGDPPVLVADVRRLREELGWVPRFSLEEGVMQTVQWWREQRAHLAASECRIQ
jgi:nucleoside-diphosphate-sugar epimerase